MPDDYSAPLGIDRDRPRPRWRLWPFATAAIVAGLAFVVGWAALYSGPERGQPSVRVAVPAAPPAPAAPAAPAEPPDDPSGQIIIRDP